MTAKSHANNISSGLSKVLHWLGDLFVPSKWTQGTISDFLNADTEEDRRVLTDLFVTTTLTNYNTIGVTSALVAGVISGAFSWYNIEQTHWTVKAVWYSGLVFAFASISATGLCSGSLLRLQCHSRSTEQIRAVVGYQKRASSPWKARPLQPWIWGCPGMLLKVSIVLFVVGLAIDLWNIALASRLPGLTEDMKIATFVTCAAFVALAIYVTAVIGLFYRTISHEEKS